jgi:hypothetical protein
MSTGKPITVIHAIQNLQRKRTEEYLPAKNSEEEKLHMNRTRKRPTAFRRMLLSEIFRFY